MSLRGAKRRGNLFAIIICFLAALFYAYDYFIQVAPSVITSQLMDFFNIHAAGLGVLSAMFFYSYTIMQIPAGVVLDKIGARKSLSIAMFISGVGLGIFALTPSFVVASFGRLIIGVGSAFAFLSALYLISHWFSAKYFPMLAGVVQVFGCMGSIIGQAPLALLMHHYHWRAVLFGISVVTIALAAIYYLVIRDSDSTKEPANEAASKIEETASVASSLTELLKTPRLLLIALIGFICWLPVGGIAALWGVPYLVAAYGVSNFMAGKIVAMFWIALALSSPLIGYAASKIKNKPLILITCFLSGIIAILMLNNAAHLSINYMWLAFFLLGCTSGLQALTFEFTRKAVSPDVFSTASGLVNMAAILGGGLAQTISGFILSAFWHGQKIAGAPVYLPSAYHMAFYCILACLVIGVVLSQCYTRRI